MVYGRGFDSRRLHQYPQVRPPRAVSTALFHSAIKCTPIQRHPRQLGVSRRVSNCMEARDGGIGRSVNRLSDARIRAFLKQATAGTATVKKLSDGAGLYITVTPAGTPV